MISFILCLVINLIAVAFYTLFERKILSLRQGRLGPNKVTLKGVFQPLLDGVKLIFKELLLLKKRYKRFFLMGPRLAFIVMLLF
jgi:NADH:ubiquinone oxidoreductase subunit H